MTTSQTEMSLHPDCCHLQSTTPLHPIALILDTCSNFIENCNWCDHSWVKQPFSSSSVAPVSVSRRRHNWSWWQWYTVPSSSVTSMVVIHSSIIKCGLVGYGTSMVCDSSWHLLRLTSTIGTSVDHITNCKVAIVSFGIMSFLLLPLFLGYMTANIW